MSTKDKILRSALKLFAKQGINKTSTSQITKDAGVAEGTLFVHFKTKQELIDTLYIQMKRQAFAKLGKVFNPELSAEHNFKAMAKHTIEHFLKNYNQFIFMGLVEIDPQVSKKALEAGASVYIDISQAFEQWKKDGKLRDLDNEFIGAIILSLMNTIVKYLKGKKIKEVDDIYLDVIWRAVGA